jgi:hypothetical protein
MKQLNLLFFICFAILFVKCSKTESNQPPSVTSLTYPSNNLLCISNNINFSWSAATDPENDKIEYNIIIAKDRALTNVLENRTISNRQVTIELEKQTAYYWKVEALDVNNNQGTSSEIFAFYTQGDGFSNYVPFTSALLTPENEGSITSSSANLTWDAADVNTNDTLTYEVFFGENENPTLIDDNVSNKSYSVSVESGKTYFWKVNVKDQNGAKSIGEIWSFTVN